MPYSKFKHKSRNKEESFVKKYGTDPKIFSCKKLDLLVKLKPPQKQEGYILTALHIKPNEDICRLKCCLAWEKFLSTSGKLILEKAIIKKNYEFLYEKFYDFERVNSEILNDLFVKRYGKDYDDHGLILPIGVFKNKEESNKHLKNISYKKSNIAKYGNTYNHGLGGFSTFNPPLSWVKNNDYGDDKMNKIMSGAAHNKELANEHFQARTDYMREKARRDLVKNNQVPKNNLTKNQFRNIDENEFEEIFSSCFDPEDQFKLRMDGGINKEARQKVKSIVEMEASLPSDVKLRINPKLKEKFKIKNKRKTETITKLKSTPGDFII